MGSDHFRPSNTSIKNTTHSCNSDCKEADVKHVAFAPTTVRKRVERSIFQFVVFTVRDCFGIKNNRYDSVPHNKGSEKTIASKADIFNYKNILKYARLRPSPKNKWPSVAVNDKKNNETDLSHTNACNTNSTELFTIPLHLNMHEQNQTIADEQTTAFFSHDSRFESISKQLGLMQGRQRRMEYTNEILDNRKFCRPYDSTSLLPCDEEEINRLRHLHYMLRFAIQGNYLAPVNELLRKGANVLNLGYGPGLWSLDISEKYPASVIVSLDIASMVPRKSKAKNCVFHECNLLQPLPFDDDTFDYIFIRFLGQAVECSKWSNLLLEVTRVLKPYGWVEWIEKDYELHRPGPHTAEVNQKLLSLMTENKQDAHIGCSMARRLLETTKLMHVTSTFVSCPGGPWAGKLGQLALQSWKAYYVSLGPLLRRSWGISSEMYFDKLKLCWREANIHKTFENIHFCYAQKRNTSMLFPNAATTARTPPS